jgi:hypothetical protein
MSPTDRQRLARLADEYESKARSLRLALTLLDAELATGSTKRAGTTIAQALTLDATRRANGNGNGNGNGHAPAEPAPKKRGRPRKRTLKQQRQQSADFLAQFSATEPRNGTGSLHGFGSLVRRGYLKRRKDGYVRTEKEYVV